MENNTKIAIGLAAAVVVGYIVYNKSKKPKAPTSGSTSKCTGQFAVECNDGSCDVGNGKNAPCLGRGGEKGAKANPDYGYLNPRMSGTCPEGYTYNSLAGCIPYAITE